MLRSCLSIAIAGLLGAAAASAPISARASVLYKCDTADGSIAYTSTQKGFSHCKVLSTYADSPKTAAVARAPKPSAPPMANGAAKSGWVYQENVVSRPAFSDVVSGVASNAPRPVFANAVGGFASTAPILIPSPVVAPPVKSAQKTAAATAVSALPRILRGAVYKIARKDGITEYTNIKPAGSAFAVLFTYIATCVACDLHSKIDFARTALNLDAYKGEIAAAAADYGVDGSLLRAVIHAESAFNPLAVSAKGAQGLMQLMPGPAGDLGVTNAFDAAQNIRGGARYLAELLKDFNGDSRLATAAYNAGAGAVQKYRGVPPYDETQVYVQRVATLRDRYHKAM